MHLRADDFRAKPKQDVKLKQWPTEVEPFYRSERDYEKLLDEHRRELCDRQGLFYADKRYALLLIFQAMDAAGKDSAIKHVMSGVNPQGCQVSSFQPPSAEELAHDFLWRASLRLPERGRIGIFNRSYYEEVLIVRVHPDLLAAQKLPPATHGDAHVWKRRYRSINDFERHLDRNGTRILKFFLHLSPEEQARRFMERIDDPEKNYKFSEADMTERKLWPKYQEAYASCLSHTNTKHAPWYIVPADDKKNARLIISRVIVDTLDALDLKYPVATKDQQRELKKHRKRLAAET